MHKNVYSFWGVKLSDTFILYLTTLPGRSAVLRRRFLISFNFDRSHAEYSHWQFEQHECRCLTGCSWQSIIVKEQLRKWLTSMTALHENLSEMANTFGSQGPWAQIAGCTLYCRAPSDYWQRWGLESLDSDSSRTRVPILLDSDSDSSPSHLDSDSDSDFEDMRTRTWLGLGPSGFWPDSANCTDKNLFQATSTC